MKKVRYVHVHSVRLSCIQLTRSIVRCAETARFSSLFLSIAMSYLWEAFNAIGHSFFLFVRSPMDDLFRRSMPTLRARVTQMLLVSGARYAEHS